MNKELWWGKKYSYFCHRTCESFPCHKGIKTEDFNCLFCYCPLYALGERCGGDYKYNDRGIKDCSGCNIPHERENYGYIIGRFNELAELAKKKS